MFARIRSFLVSDNISILAPSLLFLSLLATIANPFGATGMSFAGRLLFWLLVLCVAALVVCFSCLMVDRHAAHVRQGIRDGLIVAAITILFTPALWLLIHLIAMPAPADRPDAWSMTRYGTIFASGLLIVRRGIAWGGPKVHETNPELPRIYKRLPEACSAQILRLTVRDHFVDVITTEGVHTIRLRFADAIDEMHPVRGHCTHRSHWVTEAAIESIERSAGKIQIRLSNGDLVPVSRKYRPTLEKAEII
ncbi:LytTR family DNA-binding domain-containing protein [Ruegeria marina]|uniref:Transcriptional regulator, LytTR family n=1 Tax=Ruegeria marina TaxID=639004 RepID=A0A1G6TMA9_9RHOB|nr:LytTR family DNA-binding domain-containing protein [Ruegeria marina]SDD29994.1 transcriptional regulator, LytTR family [Ruegeria marina]